MPRTYCPNDREEMRTWKRRWRQKEKSKKIASLCLALAFNLNVPIDEYSTHTYTCIHSRSTNNKRFLMYVHTCVDLNQQICVQFRNYISLIHFFRHFVSTSHLLFLAAYVGILAWRAMQQYAWKTTSQFDLRMGNRKFKNAQIEILWWLPYLAQGCGKVGSKIMFFSSKRNLYYLALWTKINQENSINSKQVNKCYSWERPTMYSPHITVPYYYTKIWTEKETICDLQISLDIKAISAFSLNSFGK